MSDVLALCATPALSPGFERARKLSRVMAAIFTTGFCLTLLGTLLILIIPFVSLQHGHVAVGLGSISVWQDGVQPQDHIRVGLNDISVSLDGLSLGQRVWVLLALEFSAVPIVFLLHHTRRVFQHFARGEIFVLPVIGHIRQAGLWLIISFFAGIAAQIALKTTGLMPPGQAQGTAWPLVIGAVTTIAAYVMEEARRIAADSAEIV